MTVYRIKHKPTGLFFQPTNRTTANLGCNGKVYTRKPSLKNLDTNLAIRYFSRSGFLSEEIKLLLDHFKIDRNHGSVRIEETWVYINVFVLNDLNDFEIIKYKLEEL
jgi:hypothetical protein